MTGVTRLPGLQVLVSGCKSRKKEDVNEQEPEEHGGEKREEQDYREYGPVKKPEGVRGQHGVAPQEVTRLQPAARDGRAVENSDAEHAVMRCRSLHNFSRVLFLQRLPY